MVTVATIWAMPTGSKLVWNLKFLEQASARRPIHRPQCENENPSAVALCAVAYADFLLQGLKARASLDHLVGAGEQRREQGQGECFCRLQVDQQFKSGRLSSERLTP
jgi:hypothetical protein